MNSTVSSLSVTLVRSPIGHRPAARATVEAIGLRRIHQTVVLPDNESVRGMILSVNHLLRVEILDGERTPPVSDGIRPGVAITRIDRTASKSQTTSEAESVAATSVIPAAPAELPNQPQVENEEPVEAPAPKRPRRRSAKAGSDEEIAKNGASKDGLSSELGSKAAEVTTADIATPAAKAESLSDKTTDPSKAAEGEA